MKYILIAIIWLLNVLHTLGEVSAVNLAYQFDVLPATEQIRANLPKGREEEVIKNLMVDTQLRINHVPSVDRVIARYIETEGKTSFRRVIEDSCSPYLIEKLAPILYKEDQTNRRYWGEGHTDLGQSAAATLLIGKLLVKSPEFSEDVKSWAKMHLTVAPWYGSIATARQFWEVNQESLKAQKFDKVIVPPGPPLHPAPITAAEAAQRAAKRLADAQQENEQREKPNPPKQKNSLQGYGWIIGLVIALLAGITWLVRFFVVRKHA